MLDADATPLEPQDGHFAPRGADRGARPEDDVFCATRRDELVWLELQLAPGAARAGTVRLRCLRADGGTQVFEATARASAAEGRRGVSIGDPIAQVFASWATARELGAFPRRGEAATADELLASCAWSRRCSPSRRGSVASRRRRPAPRTTPRTTASRSIRPTA